MLPILFFLLVVLLAGLGFGWLADRPGEVVINWLGGEVQLSVVTGLVILALLVAAVLAIAWLLTGLVKAPRRIGRYTSDRSRTRMHRLLTGGILAAGAGDAATARRLVQKATRETGARDEPLLHFLDAQTAMIEGDHARARRIFESMEGKPQTRLLALRGLYLEAERTGDAAACRRIAEQAVRLAPQVPWAGSAVLELKAAEGDYDSALSILKAQRNARLLDKSEGRRLRAVLLAGKAETLVASDPAAARSLAREAQSLEPSLVPAALIGARAMSATGDVRGAGKTLEKAWTETGHPEVAEAYVHSRPGESAAERLTRARRLAGLRPQDVESNLAVGHAALAAGDLPLARREAEAALAKEPREAVYVLLAGIEEAEGAGEARVRERMAEALVAPRDPAWMAEGVAAPSWAAVSPTSGRLDAYRWGVPSDRPAPIRTIAGGSAAPSRTGAGTALVAADAAKPYANGAVITADEAGDPPVPAPGSAEDRKTARFNI